MNILIPHSWLLEYLETDATPLEIQKFLSLCGPSIERIYEREGDSVYDIEVTTNRVDSMSVLGIAREAAVILPHFGKKAKLKSVKIEKPAKPTSARYRLPLPEIIDDQKICKRTMCIVLSNAQRTETPDWMAKRLRQIDGTIHDAVIDITNYVTHELGHPCHAFDYDKVMELGGIIEVKIAKAGKKFTTLDGAEYTTVGGEVVFENGEGVIIDLPGIKGLANTSINQSTKNVLFWLENIEAKRIRFASMTHAIRTVAAQLNEKNVDPTLAEDVLNKGVELFVDLTRARIASKVYDHFPAQKKMATITVPLQRIYDYLGIELSVNQMGKILEDLGCEVTLKGESKTKSHAATVPSFIVTPPTFRPDVQIPADVIEEIARIYGYHNLPSALMPTAIPLIKPTDTNFWMENRIKRFLSDIGWQEVYTYSMVSDSIAQQSGYSLSEHLKIQNPLSDDRVYLRRSLIPSLREVIQANSTRKDLSVFELAKVYNPQTDNIPNQPQQLGLVSTLPYREVKGIVEALYGQFYVNQIEINQNGQIFAIAEDNTKHLQGQVTMLPDSQTGIMIDLYQFLRVVRNHPTYRPLPKTSEIIEDITFTLPEKTLVGNVIAHMNTVSKYLVSIRLASVYQQNYSFTFTYHTPEKNLTVDDIGPIRKKIAQQVLKQFGGKLVGTLE